MLSDTESVKVTSLYRIGLGIVLTGLCPILPIIGFIVGNNFISSGEVQVVSAFTDDLLWGFAFLLFPVAGLVMLILIPVLAENKLGASTIYSLILYGSSFLGIVFKLETSTNTLIIWFVYLIVMAFANGFLFSKVVFFEVPKKIKAAA